MAWIESHEDLATHPKTKRAARMLGISVPQMVGHLHFLWWWCLKYAQDGDLSQYDVQDIADAAGWEGDTEQFVTALIECGPGDSYGFLEKAENGGIVVHDWMDYAGRLMEQRKLQNKRSKRKRDLYGDEELTRAVRKRDGDYCRYCGKEVNWNDRKGVDGGTYDKVDPEGPTTVDNIVVVCRGCAVAKDGRTLEQAGMSLLPTDISARNLPEICQKSAIPNLTIHKEINNDDDDNAHAREFLELLSCEFSRSLLPEEVRQALAVLKRTKKLAGDHAPALLREAVQRCTMRGISKVNYLSSIIANWEQKGIATLEQLASADAQRVSRSTKVKGGNRDGKNSRSHQVDDRGYYDNPEKYDSSEWERAGFAVTGT